RFYREPAPAGGAGRHRQGHGPGSGAQPGAAEDGPQGHQGLRAGHPVTGPQHRPDPPHGRGPGEGAGRDRFMPVPASLSVACLCAELFPFRGPGFYFSLVKLGLTLVLYFCWVSLADWVNRDTDEAGTRAETWNPVVLGSGLLGLLLLWAVPWFVLGL